MRETKINDRSVLKKDLHLSESKKECCLTLALVAIQKDTDQVLYA